MRNSGKKLEEEKLRVFSKVRILSGKRLSDDNKNHFVFVKFGDKECIARLAQSVER